jgi:platelet-activating factor acetylhydrolase IB subunit alpha
VEAADHFVSCLRWAPSVFKENSGATDGAAQKNGDAVLEQIRCLVACGSVDLNVRVFSA